MLEKKRIYVVEDEWIIAHTLSVILEQNGFATETFSDAESALARVEASAPDMVITDVILLGKMTGLELTEHIAYEHPSVKVLMMSGQARTSELLAGYRERGLSPSIKEKPIAPQTLLEEIQEIFRRFGQPS